MEFIPLILVFSIVVFIIGLVDSLFALSHGLDGLSSASMYTASGVSCAIFIAVLSAVGGTVYHSLLHGAVSPFQSFLSRFRQARTTVTDPVQAEHAYREILIETYDDTNLIDACGSLNNLMDSFFWKYRGATLEMRTRLIDVLEFLLSPQTNKRCMLTAASFIGQYYSLMNWICT
jgi:hypothetical protein